MLFKLTTFLFSFSSSNFYLGLALYVLTLPFLTFSYFAHSAQHTWCSNFFWHASSLSLLHFYKWKIFRKYLLLPYLHILCRSTFLLSANSLLEASNLSLFVYFVFQTFKLSIPLSNFQNVQIFDPIVPRLSGSSVSSLLASTENNGTYFI